MRVLLITALIVLKSVALMAAPPTADETRSALNKAVTFFRTQVSADGGYLWSYSADLAERAGENAASKTTIWIQPPGTPAVGEALLEAWLVCREPALLEAARDAAHVLADGQLLSGGWDYRIETDPALRGGWAYRVDAERSGKTPSPKARNVTTLDDDNTQSALRFLLKMDHLPETRSDRIHAAVDHALSSLLKAQYANGAWPQRYSSFPGPDQYPPLKATYPESWSRTFPKLDYTGYCTLNDDTLADLIDTMFLAAALRKDDRCSAAARRAGEFLIRAQMPEPQPTWAQQYNEQMQPAWARKFEPPAITGGESQGAIRILLTLYRHTGDAKFLAPIPKALDWLERSQLPEGGLARFYELRTNRPLYFTKDYVLTHDDNDLPTHYGFKVGSNGLKSLRQQLEDSRQGKAKPPQVWTAERRAPKVSDSLRDQAATVLAALDERGAWVEDGRMKAIENSRATRIITTTAFMKNIATLSRYLAAVRSADR